MAKRRSNGEGTLRLRADGRWEMTIMAAIVIGGPSVRGGLGKISGVFFGVLFVQFITNLINLDGHISAYWKDIITGIVLLLAVLIQVYTEKKKEQVKHERKLEGAAA